MRLSHFRYATLLIAFLLIAIFSTSSLASTFETTSLPISPTCKACQEIPLDVLVHSNQHVVKGTVEWMSREATDGFFKVRIRVMGKCAEHPWEIGTLKDIIVPVTACNIQSLYEGTTWIFIANDENHKGTVVPCVISCGLIDVDWLDIERICGNPCKTCTQDLLWLVKNNPTALKFQAIVLDEIIVDKHKVAARVKILAACNGLTVGSQHIITFGSHDCKASLVEPGETVTLLGTPGIIEHPEGNVEVIEILDCGILPGTKWPDVEAICNPCLNCNQDLVWLVKKNPTALKFQGRVMEMVEIDKEHAAAKVKVLDACGGLTTESVEIVVWSQIACKANLITAGATVTLFGNYDTIHGVSAIRILDCGILPGSKWPEVEAICNPCINCNQDVEWLVKQNPLSTSVRINQVLEHIEYQGAKYVWVSVKILNSCDSTSDLTSEALSQPVKILVPLSACNFDRIVAGATLTLFGEWRMVGSVKVIVIAQCGVTTIAWPEVEAICNPCINCNQDVEWLVKQNPLAVSARIVQVHEHIEYQGAKYVWVSVKILNSCDSPSDLTSEALIQPVKILVPLSACNFDRIVAGATLTLFGERRMVGAVQVIVIAQCGVTTIAWPPVEAVCNPCVNCNQDVHWLLKENPLAVSVRVIQVHQHVEIQGAKFVWVSVEVFHSCNPSSDLSLAVQSSQPIKILVPLSACNFGQLVAGITLTLFGESRMVGSAEVIVIAHCGITTIPWPEVEVLCNPCVNCNQDIVWLLKENPLAFSARVVHILEEVTVSGVKYFWVAVNELKVCENGGDDLTAQVSVGTVKLLVPAHACNRELIVSGAVLTWFGRWREVNGAKFIVIANCGVTTIPWPEVEAVCNPCINCTQDVEWLVKQNPLSSSVQIIQVHEHVEIQGAKYVWVSVKILNSCDSGSDLTTTEAIGPTVKILVPLSACNFGRIVAGATLTLFGEWRMVGTFKVIVIAQCGVTTIAWPEVEVLCNACVNCHDDAAWLLKENPLAVSVRIIQVHEHVEVQGVKLAWVSVTILNVCDSGSVEMNSTNPVKILIPLSACNFGRIVAGATLTLFGERRLIPSLSVQKVTVIAHCGITTIPWSEVSSICNPCVNCNQDIVWLLKENPLIFSARVVAVNTTQKVSVSGVRYFWVNVKVLKVCEESELAAHVKHVDVTQILVPAHACRIGDVTVGATLTLSGMWVSVGGEKVIIIAQCGITTLGWNHSQICPHKPEKHCPIVVIRPDGSECLCRNEARPICAVHSKTGFERTFLNACVARCSQKWEIVCNAPCDQCQRLCIWD